MFEYNPDDTGAICYDCAHQLKFCQCKGGPSLSEIHSYKRQIAALRAKYASAVRTLQRIATDGRIEPGDWSADTAASTLKQLGEPVEVLCEK